MRLFTGIGLPDALQLNIARLIDALRPSAHLHWSAAYNLHLTTKFIGDWPEDRLDELRSALAPLGDRDPIRIALHGIGWFPNPHAPRVLFAAVQAGPALERLAHDTGAACARLGIPTEIRPFSPHLTLARIKDRAVPLAPLRTAIAGLQSLDFGEFTAGAFHLFLSQPGPAGSIYTQLAEVPFTGSIPPKQ